MVRIVMMMVKAMIQKNLRFAIKISQNSFAPRRMLIQTTNNPSPYPKWEQYWQPNMFGKDFNPGLFLEPQSSFFDFALTSPHTKPALRSVPEILSNNPTAPSEGAAATTSTTTTPTSSAPVSRNPSTQNLITTTETDPFDIGVDNLYRQAFINRTAYLNLINSRSWVALDVNQVATLPDKQRDQIQQWASKMLRNATLSTPDELSKSLFGLFAVADNAYKRVIEYTNPAHNAFPNVIEQCYPLSHFPCASDEQLAQVVENVAKIFIAGMLLSGEQLQDPKPMA
jgi:hypothetical protein